MILSLPITAILTLFFILVFGAYPLSWSGFPYDEWRLMQIVLLALLPILLLFQRVNHPHQNQAYRPPLILFITNTVSIIYVFFVAQSLNLLTMLCIYSLLLSLLYQFSFFLKQIFATDSKFLLSLSLTPFLTAVWLPIETILLQIQSDIAEPKAWLGGFLNPRQYDDVTLPLICLFFGLTLSKKWQYLRIFLASIILWGCINNGARGIFFSFFLGMIITSFIQRKWRWSLQIISSICLAALWSTLDNANSIIRYTSSGRVEIWSNALQIWQHNFWLGRLEQGDYINVLHPHNLVLQLLADYGLIGIIVLLSAVVILSPIWQSRFYLSPVALMGTIAIICNGLLSGSMVYPHSQIANIVFLAWALSQTNPKLPYPTPTFLKHINYMYNASYLLIMAILIYYQLPNLSQRHSTSETLVQSENDAKTHFAPYLWQFGKTEYLQSKANLHNIHKVNDGF